MIDRLELYRNIEDVRLRLRTASAAWPHEAELCAVTKTVDAKTINETYGAGVRAIGENRVQEVINKLPALNPDFRLHIIGQLQTNKVKYIIDTASMIQSLDRLELAREIDKRARLKGLIMPVLAQVNIAREPQKAGLDEQELMDFLCEVASYKGLRVSGLMAIMPIANDPEEVRPYFRRMRALFDHVRAQELEGIHMECLSMGMSGDYEVAAQEGATMVRVGSSIFGAR